MEPISLGFSAYETNFGDLTRRSPLRKPYVKRNKNDAADAEAICEAVKRPEPAGFEVAPLRHAGEQHGGGLEEVVH